MGWSVTWISDLRNDITRSFMSNRYYDMPPQPSSDSAEWVSSLRSVFSFRRRLPAIMSLAHTSGQRTRNKQMSPHRFLMASLLPILRAGFTASARFTFPICLRFNFDGLGSFSIHSGTGEPDWRRTLAILVQRDFQYRVTWIRETSTNDFRYGASSSVK